MFTKNDCKRGMYDSIPNKEDNEGEIAIVKPEWFSEAYKGKKDFQLVRLQGGFGCRPSANGNACYVEFCVDGEKTRIDRYYLYGIANDDVASYARQLEEARKNG